jgi:pyrimidine-nucleoside phosphorylase
MLVLAGVAPDDTDADRRVRAALASGAGLEKFRAVIAQQGGDPRVIDDYSLLPMAKSTVDWTAPRSGFITAMHAGLVGRAAVALGAGRDRIDAGVDHSVGIEVIAPIGTLVRAGDPVLRLSSDDAGKVATARLLLDQAVEIDDLAPPVHAMVIDVIDGRTVTL